MHKIRTFVSSSQQKKSITSVFHVKKQILLQFQQLEIVQVIVRQEAIIFDSVSRHENCIKSFVCDKLQSFPQLKQYENARVISINFTTAFHKISLEGLYLELVIFERQQNQMDIFQRVFPMRLCIRLVVRDQKQYVFQIKQIEKARAKNVQQRTITQLKKLEEVQIINREAIKTSQRVFQQERYNIRLVVRDQRQGSPLFK